MFKEPNNRKGGHGERLSHARSIVRQENNAYREMERMENLELMLTWRSKKINEGNNGVILEVDLSKPLLIENKERPINNRIIEAEPHKMIVGKILKIYSAGMGRREFEMQKMAREAIGRNEFVRVPRAFFSKRLMIADNEFRKFLRSVGIDTAGQRTNVDMIAMEKVKGKDLDHFAYEQFILAYAAEPQFSGQCPAKSWPEYFKTANKRELRNYILDKLDLPISNLADVAVREGLRGRNLLPTGAYAGMKAAIRSLHRAGLYHRDLHAGNIMIEQRPEGDAKQNKLCLIDFGTAKAVDPKIKGKKIDSTILTLHRLRTRRKFMMDEC